MKYLLLLLFLIVLPMVNAKVTIVENRIGTTINGSAICTQANGYCAGQPAQGNGTGGYLAEWINGSYLTSSTLTTSYVDGLLHEHDQDLNTTDTVRFEGIGIQAAALADADINGSMYVHGGNGDVNGDNTISITDITELGSYLTDSTYAWDSGYTARADINGDNKVDYLDYDYIFSAFGSSEVSEALKREARYVIAGLSVQKDGYVLVGKEPPWAKTNSYADSVGDLYILGDLEVRNNTYLHESLIQPTGAAGVPLTIQGAAGQTGHLLEFQDSAGTQWWRVEDDGTIRTDAGGLKMWARKYGATPYAFQVTAQSYPSSGAGAAISLQPYVYPQANLANAYGTIRLSRIGAYGGTSYNFTQYRNVFDRIDILDDNVIGSAINYQIASPNVGTGSITNLYGLNIQDMTAGTNSNYAILTGSGLVSFGDDMVVTGNSTINLHYAAGYIHNDTRRSMSIPATNTYYNITDWTITHGNGFSGNETEGRVTALVGGEYKFDMSFSFSGGGGDTYHVALAINDAEVDQCHGTRKLGTAGDVGNMGITCVVTLSANDELQLWIEDLAVGASDISIYDFNANLVRIGG